MEAAGREGWVRLERDSTEVRRPNQLGLDRWFLAAFGYEVGPGI